MVDIVYTLRGVVRRAFDNVLSKGDAGNLKAITVTRSVTARSQNDTIRMLKIPSNARLWGLSDAAWDDLDSAGAPTMDIGVASVDSNITSDADALNDGLDVTSAGTAKLIKDHADYGKRAWEFVSGQTVDPGGELEIYVSFVDAATNLTGDVTLNIAYTLD